MRTPKINSKKLAAALAPIVLAGAVTAPAAAASTPASSNSPVAVDSNVGFSRGFHIYNYSAFPIKLINITGKGNFEGRPADGTVLNTGESTDVEVTWEAFSTQEDTAHFAIMSFGGSQEGTFDVNMTVNDGGEPSSNCVSSSPWKCVDDIGPEHGTNRPIALLDSPGTVEDLYGNDKQRQAEALKQLCDTGLGHCTFTPTKEEHVLGAPHFVGEAVDNPKENKESTTIKSADMVSVSDSLGVAVEAGVEGIVKAAVSYEHEWTHEHEFDQEIETEVPAHTTLWYCHEAPVIRDTGDFTATLGNTTWHLIGVYFETPDLTEHHQLGHYFPNTEPYPNRTPAGSCSEAQATQGLLLKLF